MKPLLYAFFVAILWSGCTKDNDILYPDPFFPGQQTFKAPLFIEVMTTEGLRVSNAKINLGTLEGYTDAGGLLYVDEATVGTSAYLTVEKEGFFDASRRFYPAAGKAQFIRIILLSDSRIAFFNAKDGAVLPIEDRASIHFPLDGYVLSNGEAYDGVVVVSAKSISADDPDLSFKMPGDLVGVNNTGKLGALGSLGMIAVEMNTPSGEKIEFDKGVEASLEMIIPPAMADKAPSAVPLWYFDEYDGVWREEGLAERNGDRYIGKVKHFSFWNCDAWFETVSWGASFSYENSSPASQVKVCIDIENLGTSSCAYTDAGGAVRGMVAAKELLGLKVYGKCGQEIFTTNIGPYTNEHFFGPVPISDPTVQSHVSGVAVNCQREPLANGYVKISTGITTDYLVPDISTGAFDAIVYGCTAGNISVLAYNIQEETYSVPLSIPFNAEIHVDTLITCGNLDDEYALVVVEGFPDVFLFDDLTFREESKEGYTTIYSEGNVECNFNIWFKGSGPGVYEVESSDIYVNLGNNTYSQSFDVRIEIDQYGGVGSYVKGKVTGILYTSQNLLEPHYPFEATFSVLREH